MEDALFEKADKSDSESKGTVWGHSEDKRMGILSKVPKFMRVARHLSLKSRRRSSVDRDVRALELSKRGTPMDNPLALGLRHDRTKRKSLSTGSTGLKVIGKNQAEIDQMKGRVAELQIRVSRHKEAQKQAEKRTALGKSTTRAAKGEGKKLVRRVDDKMQDKRMHNL